MRSGRSVRDGARTIREGSVGSMRSGSVRDGSVGSMLSGPVSEGSARSVGSSVSPLAEGQSIGESSVGAVKKRRDEPLGTRISESLTDLEQMQEELRYLQLLPEEGAEAELPPFDEEFPLPATEPELGSEFIEEAWQPDQPEESVEPVAGEIDSADEPPPHEQDIEAPEDEVPPM